jgi:2-oxoisovalerate ferredoxin oxidoreductase beta subunit
MIKHQKPKSFYDAFERKGPGEQVSHYCQACGWGTVQKLIAEAVDDLGIQDRIVMCSPVGCAVFAYYYMDVGNIQCAHGRAPAVATGLGRAHEWKWALARFLYGAKDAGDRPIRITLQGDGDLGGIGMGGIIHSAARGEPMAVFFGNNSTCGMTGGQMAPTTPVGHFTATTPHGRDPRLDGYPIGMCEVLDTLKAPAFIERVSVADIGRIRKARKAIRKALEIQKNGRGFALVEFIMPCSMSLGMKPVEARKWTIENAEPVFPLGNFRDKDVPPALEPGPVIVGYKLLSYLGVDGASRQDSCLETRTIEDQLVKIAGAGGQGVSKAGVVLANCGMREDLHVTWVPSYGPQMRGGKSYSVNKLSNRKIGSPTVDRPNVLIVMNRPSLDAFEDTVEEGGLILADSSNVGRKVRRDDVTAYYVPASEIADGEMGNKVVALMMLLSIYVKSSGVVGIETLRQVIPEVMGDKLAGINLRAVERGIKHLEEHPIVGYEGAGASLSEPRGAIDEFLSKVRNALGGNR